MYINFKDIKCRYSLAYGDQTVLDKRPWLFGETILDDSDPLRIIQPIITIIKIDYAP